MQPAHHRTFLALYSQIHGRYQQNSMAADGKLGLMLRMTTQKGQIIQSCDKGLVHQL